MNKNKQLRMVIMSAVMVLVLALGAVSAHADDSDLPVIVPEQEQVTQPAQDQPEPTVDDESDPTPHALTYEYDVYVSAPGNGTYGIINYGDEDILRYSTHNNSWAKVFDGTNYGLPASADIDAIAYQPINLGQIWYISFDRPTAVPGLGTVDDSDVVAHTYVFGQNGSWSMVFDGSQYGLTTDAEDIDALDFGPGNALIISTLGSYNVPKYGGGTLKGPDEDLIAFHQASGTFIAHLDATTLGIAGANDINGYAYVRVNDDELRFLTVARAAQLKLANYNYAPVTLQPHDIGVHERPWIGSQTFGVIWDASDNGFPKVDAIDIVKR